jgi:hypothetical protein
VHAKAPVDGGAVEAEEDAVGNGCPGGVLGAAVEAHLHITARPWPCEVDLVGRRRAADLGREKGVAAVTLFSDLALRRRKTAFLSVKASNAMAAALHCSALLCPRDKGGGECAGEGGPRSGREEGGRPEYIANQKGGRQTTDRRKASSI